MHEFGDVVMQVSLELLIYQPKGRLIGSKTGSAVETSTQTKFLNFHSEEIH